MYASCPVRSSWLAFAVLAYGLFLSTESPALERDVVVTVYQGPCKDGDFTANVATAREVVQQARARGSHFLVFPEEFLSGCDSLEHLRSGARRLDDPELSAFIKETADHDLVVLAGLARLTDEGIYNSVLVTATIPPAMFKHPYVWATLDEVSKWLRAELADQLTAD